MTCPNMVGVKNLTLAFRDCANDAVGSVGDIRQRTHSMSADELPKYKTTDFKLESLTAGKVKRTYENARIEVMIVRDDRIPLSYYQGRAAITYQCEHMNGHVVTGVDGFVTDVEPSDGNDVSLTIQYARLDELLPAGLVDA